MLKVNTYYPLREQNSVQCLNQQCIFFVPKNCLQRENDAHWAILGPKCARNIAAQFRNAL